MAYPSHSTLGQNQTTQRLNIKTASPSFEGKAKQDKSLTFSYQMRVFFFWGFQLRFSPPACYSAEILRLNICPSKPKKRNEQRKHLENLLWTSQENPLLFFPHKHLNFHSQMYRSLSEACLLLGLLKGSSLTGMTILFFYCLENDAQFNLHLLGNKTQGNFHTRLHNVFLPLLITAKKIK